MLAIYLCGAVLITVAATMFPAATPGPVLLAGPLWPVVVAETWDRRTLVASGSR